MTEPTLGEIVTVSIDIRRILVPDDEALLQVYLDFKRNGWVGGVMDFNGTARLQLNKGDEQIISAAGQIIVCIEGTWTSLTTDEYAARYGTTGEGES